MELASLERLFIFFIIIVPLAIIHEYFHGYAAHLLGDPTAKYAGRLTLNPLAHIDLFGTVIMPISLSLLSGGSFVFAYAKPVPVNPLNLRGGKTAWALVALAGPAANFLTALIFAIILRFSPWEALNNLLAIIVFYSLLLGVFNLLPVPPLDGSKVLFSVLPKSWLSLQIILEQYGFFIILIFLLFGFPWLSPIINWLFTVLTGWTI